MSSSSVSRRASFRQLILFPLACAGTIQLSACASGLNAIDVSSSRQIAVDRDTALKSINAFRHENGAGSVRFSSVLDQAAERQARAMAASGHMSHTLDGDLRERVKVYGYDWAAVDENLGWNYQSVPQVMKGWKDSPGHRRNLLDPNVTEVGLAAATGRSGEPYWALILGRQRFKR